MRTFFIVLALAHCALIATAVFYSQQSPQNRWISSAALPAFLLEATFYLSSVFCETRSRIERFQGKRMQAAILWVTAVLPYLVFASASGSFNRNAFYLLAGLAGVFAFWYAISPRRLAYDFGFFIIAAAPLLTKVFPRIYVSPDSHIHVDVLGHLMWIRVGIVAILVLREWNPGAFGFWPRAREWQTGLIWYAAVLPPLTLVAIGLNDVRWAPLSGDALQWIGVAAGTFFGMLWVVALGEELFFRGVIERAMLDSWRSPVIAVALSAVLFGSAHLWFHAFPNWRRAAVATVLGIGCGMAYLRSGSVRAPMVTHAFVVTTWRLFFRG